MGVESEKSALRALRAETEKLSDLAKTFYNAVTHDPRVKHEEPRRPVPLLHLKPSGT